MPQHYMWRKDLSKYTLKSFDSANEFVCDTNNSDTITIDKNGTQATILDSTTAIATSSPIQISGATAGGSANSAYTLLKTVTGIQDDTATTVYTVTIPNPGTGLYASAIIDLTFVGIIGAGGTIGAGEGAAGGTATVTVTRTPGANAVANASALAQTSTASVSGGDTMTFAYSLGSVSGSATATNTFTIQVTCDDDTNTSANNHVCIAAATVYNPAASGVTIA